MTRKKKRPSKRAQRLARRRKTQRQRIRRQQKRIKKAARQVKRKMEAGKPVRFAGAAFGVPVYEEVPPTIPWEVSIDYSTHEQDVDITVRIETPPAFASGSLVREKDVEGAVWRAALGKPVTLFTIGSVNWKRERVTRTGSTLYEGSGVKEDLEPFRKMMRYATWRTAPVEEGKP